MQHESPHPAVGTTGAHRGKRRNVRVQESAQPMRDSSSNTHEARTGRGQNDAGLRRATQRLAARGVGGIARLRKAFTGNREQTRTRSCYSASRSRCINPKDANRQRCRELTRELHPGSHGFQRSFR